MTWLQNSINNIFHWSKNGNDFQLALKEWLYTGDYYDNEAACETCELCEHQNLRYQFKIINLHNANELLVGSECINKFEIVATDEYGNILSNSGSRKKVKKDKLKLITQSKTKNLTNDLIKLASVENTFDINSFIDYVHDRGAFTPNQLITLLWRFDKNKISIQKSNYKMVIKRNREKEQLLKMQDWQIKKLWEVMTRSQKEWYKENK